MWRGHKTVWKRWDPMLLLVLIYSSCFSHKKDSIGLPPLANHNSLTTLRTTKTLSSFTLTRHLYIAIPFPRFLVSHFSFPISNFPFLLFESDPLGMAYNFTPFEMTRHNCIIVNVCPPSAYLDEWPRWQQIFWWNKTTSARLQIERDSIHQVIFNNKELQPIAWLGMEALHWTRNQ